MKALNRIIWILAIALLGSSALVSCDDDDDDRDLDGGASKIAGTYNGTLTAKVMTIDCNFEGTYDLQILRERGTDDDVTVVLPACSFSTPGMQTAQSIPTLTVTDVDVERSLTDVNIFTIEDDDFTVVMDNVIYSGKIRGKVEGSNISVNYTLTPGSMPMPINFTFAGSLKN